MSKTDLRINQSPQGRQVSCAMLVVGLIVLAVHWPALSTQAFSFDDTEAIADNDLIQHADWNSVRRIFGEVLSPSTILGYYRPLTQISFMFDWALGGRPNNLRQFHRTSLGLHVLNTMLLLLLMYQLFGDPLAASLAALLFGVHPLTVEPIPWVMERKTLLAATFALLSLILYVRHARHGGFLGFAGVILLYLCAVMSKPTSVPLPLAMILLDYWPLRRLSWRSVAEKGPLLMISLASSAVTYLCENRVNTLAHPGEFPWTEIPLRFCYLLMFYLSKIMWPAHLSSVYQLPEPFTWSNPVLIASVVGVILLSAAIFVSLRRSPVFAVGSLVFLGILLPTMGIVRYSWVSASDKYVYLPAVGILMIVTWLLMRLVGREENQRLCVPAKRLAATVLIVLLLVAVEARETRRDLSFWKDNETLTQHFVMLAPRAPAALAERGRHLLQNGKFEEGLPYFDALLHADPLSFSGNTNVGIALWRLGRLDEAIEHCRRALKQRPDYTPALSHMGRAFYDNQQYEEALHVFRRAAQLRPAHAESWADTGTVLVAMGRLDEAAESLQKALALDSRNAAAHCGLARVYLSQGQRDLAETEARTALTINPDLPEAIILQGTLLAQSGRSGDAIAKFRKATELSPRLAKAHYGLALALLTDIASSHPATQSGTPQTRALEPASQSSHEKATRAEAIEHLKRSVEINPRVEAYCVTLADTLSATGEFDAALAAYQKTLEANSNSARGHNGLAWLLATHPRAPKDSAAQAILHAERGVALAPDRADTLDTLAAAYAAAGRFPDAVRTLELALSKAGDQGATEGLQAMRSRMILYRANQPYRETTH